MPSDVRVPDVAGEIVGYRSWDVERFYGLPPTLLSLFGYGDDDVWPHGDWFIASCPTRRCDEPPGEGCACGIYAARNRRHLVRQGYHDGGETRVIGEVALAGKVVQHDRGWRGEKARPLRLWLPHVAWELARDLRAAYGVPVGLTNIYRP